MQIKKRRKNALLKRRTCATTITMTCTGRHGRMTAVTREAGVALLSGVCRIEGKCQPWTQLSDPLTDKPAHFWQASPEHCLNDGLNTRRARRTDEVRGCAHDEADSHLTRSGDKRERILIEMNLMLWRLKCLEKKTGDLNKVNTDCLLCKSQSVLVAVASTPH